MAHPESEQKNKVSDDRWDERFATLHSAYSELLTAHRTLEQQLVDLRELLASREQSFEAMSEGLLLVDLNGQITKVNRAATELLDRSEKEILGRTIYELLGGFDVPATPWELLERRLGEQLPPVDAEIPSRGGDAAWISIRSGIVRDGHRKVSGLVVMLQDVSERRRAQEILEESHTDLELRVAERTAELDHANKALRSEIADRVKAEKALRHLSGRLLQLQDEERKRVARELHESTAQILAAVLMKLSLLEKDRGSDAFSESLQLIQEAIRELRTLSLLLHPPVLESSGLAPAIDWYVRGFCDRSGIKVHLDIPEEMDRLPRELETALFRIVQEALANVQRHSGSPTADVRLELRKKKVFLEVTDQGRGMSGDQDEGFTAGAHFGVGIRGMEERVRQLGGKMNIDSCENGTILSVTLPLPAGSS